MHRSRSNSTLPKIQISADKENINLIFPQGWLDAHPLTQADLVTEENYLQVTNIKLVFHLEKDLASIQAHVDQLRQVIMNLVNGSSL